MKWLTPALRQEVRDRFEPRYRRKLSEAEVEEIATNLADYCELMCKFKLKQQELKRSPKS